MSNKTLQEKYNELLELMDTLVNFDHYSKDHDVFIEAIHKWYKNNQDEVHEFRKNRITKTSDENER